jgi:hypothetical protein
MMKLQPVRILSAEGRVKAELLVETADTREQQERGLMNRDSLPENQGMLFVFEKPELLMFWMESTFISLDILFADDSGTVVNIHEEMVPHARKIYASKGLAKYAIEVNAGFCRRNRICRGDKIALLEEAKKKTE